MGIEAEEQHVFTCAMATARFLAHQKPNGTAYVIGEGGLLNALHSNGYAIVDHDPDYVVVGEGRAFNFEMIETAVRMIQNGAKLVATNLDPNCPTQQGIRPGCGAIVAMLETATGRTGLQRRQTQPRHDARGPQRVGPFGRSDHHDRRHDGNRHSGGVQMGYRTVLVLSGSTTKKDVEAYAFRPITLSTPWPTSAVPAFSPTAPPPDTFRGYLRPAVT